MHQEIERFDAAHAKTVRALFNIDREDALIYNIVLNTDRVPIDACVKMVCKLARDPRFQDAEATSSALADKLLEIKVNASLTEHFGTGMGFITISAANGRIILAGTPSDGSLRRKAEKLAHGIEGVQDIDNRIMSVPSHGRGPLAQPSNASLRARS